MPARTASRPNSCGGRKGTFQVEYGLFTDAAGCAVGSAVFFGATAGPTVFVVVEVVREMFGVTGLTLVGDRGVSTFVRITALNDLGGVSWITCLRAPAITVLAADDGALQRSLFDTPDLAEITHPDYSGARLIAWRTPALATLRAATRESLIAATETLLATLTTRAQEGKRAWGVRLRLTSVLDVLSTANALREQIDRPPQPWQVTTLGIRRQVRTGVGHVVRTKLRRDLTR